MVNAGDILNYTKEDLEKLSKEELEKLHSECQYWEEFYNTQQMVEKIMINSLYGAQGNKDFILLNEKVAQAITGNGRFLVKNSANMIEDKLQKLKPYHNPASELSVNSEKSIKTQYVIYGDTDSFYFTIDPFMQEIMQKRPNLSMNEYVDIADQFCTKICEPVVQDSIKIATTKLNARRPDVIGCKRECISDSCFASYTPLRLKIDGKMESVKIGSLHNMFSNEDYRTRKPSTVDLSDKNIYIMSYNTETRKNEMKRVLNVQKKLTSKRMVEITHPKVGKIVCTEDHKFAVNQNNEIVWKRAIDITPDDDLVYNENRLFSHEYCKDCDKDLEMCGFTVTVLPHSTKFKENVVYDLEVEDNHNFFVNSVLAHNCVYVAKKKYISRVRDSEGTRYPETQPHMKTMGVELARGSTAPYCKVKLTESIDIILDKDETYLRNWIEDVRKDFMKQDLLEISNYCGISSTKLKTLGTHFIAKSAYYYNQYIVKNKLESTYGLLQSGTKARIIQLKSPNPLNPEVKYLVYNDVKFAELMREYIDFDEAFNKHFIAPLNNMVKALDIDLTKRKINFDELNDW